MSSDFSLRQVLACLNISVFDPLVEPALKKACRIDAEQKAEKRAPFHNVFSLIVLQVAALICFAGLRPYALPAGIGLVFFCAIALKKATISSWAFFFRVYFLAGLFLLAEILFRSFSFAVPVILLMFLVRSAFVFKSRETRTLLAVWFFISVFALCRTESSFFPLVPAAVFSVVGVTGLLFPLKGLYWREPSVVFATLPLFVVLGYDIFLLVTQTVFVLYPRGATVMAVAFTAEALMLICCLRKDLELGEIVLSCLAALALFLCAFLLSGGLAGTIVLFVTAYLTDARVMGRTAAVLFSCFLTVFFLSLPISLFSAGLICALSGAVFGWFYLRLKRSFVPEKA